MTIYLGFSKNFCNLNNGGYCMKSTDDYYLLEELGQSFNETLVTKLLTSTLNHSEPFAEAFVNVCKTSVKSIQKVVAISEVQFTNKKNRIDILLLIQNGTNVELFIIENKLFAGEGAEQATRYYDAVTNGGEIYKLNKIITLHFHAETVNDNLPLLVYPSEETLNRQIDLLDA